MPKHLYYVHMKSDFVTVSKIENVVSFFKIYTNLLILGEMKHLQ